MKKIQDKVLEADINKIMKANPKDTAWMIVEYLRKFQDAGGMKVVQPVQE